MCGRLSVVFSIPSGSKHTGSETLQNIFLYIKHSLDKHYFLSPAYRVIKRLKYWGTVFSTLQVSTSSVRCTEQNCQWRQSVATVCYWLSQIDIIFLLFIYLIMENVYNNDFIARKYLNILTFVNWPSWPIGVNSWCQQTVGTDGCHWTFFSV